MHANEGITISFAQSVDGRIATITGESQWISGAKTLRLAHKLRATHDCICVGIGTVLKDDPELSCRLPLRRSPLRVIFDSGIRLPLDSKIVRTADRYRTLVLAAPGAPLPKADALKSRGVEVEFIRSSGHEYVDIHEAMNRLKEKGIRNILIEGGSQLITSFLRAGVVSRIIMVTAPIIIGEGIPAIGDLGVRTLEDSMKPDRTRIRRMGTDLVWEMRFER